VNVYVVVALLFAAGIQVPEIPFVDVAGKINVLPEQIAGNCVNVGVTGVFTVTVNVVVNAHGFPVGVNV
jgi:hypothetical protein